MQIAIQTDVGMVRKHNEDSGEVFTKGEHFLAVIADGMGGHKAGDIASQEALTCIKDAWNQFEENMESIREWIQNVLRDTNNHIFQFSQENPETRGMGTTVVAALGNSNEVTVAHIGDSRCYLYSNGELKRVTDDHSLVQELVKSGQITEDEAEIHPRRNMIMKAVGTDETVEAEFNQITWNNGDYLLLCSDGLSDKVSFKRIQEALLNPQESVAEKVETLITWAKDAGGEDNITAILIQNRSDTETKGEARA
ncbi:Stp1/IreP family PP2C-type Ser/Thr phosphatase [Fictibacillus nanhaiensis]|uniref:Stp1/IreP family PP2C-type Ser/Thr phosphatase n=1 Tax=Fictibacillus nanhaiensis TaxID=742169 RepID=UPI001C946A79|nr:Stp1/IreP family PP2C-type Ser/Thr phosphatase [Fictibacillus nanhaiensis]MBY6036143.1 Stp1/IreP family PP2C-type Ser/Thr phosphatase [Fictibacillus nanhaiensis]